jgi:ABC-type uncharacterized transport system auxiliary subunit
MIIMRNATLCLLAPLTAVLLGGCATQARPHNMAYTGLTAARKHDSSVSITAYLSAEARANCADWITDTAFLEAIAMSLRHAHMFSKVVNGAQADHVLKAEIINFDMPLGAAHMTSQCIAEWTLIRQSNNEIVYRKTIQTTHTATLGDALNGNARLRMANEGAVRRNIEEAILQLSSLTL